MNDQPRSTQRWIPKLRDDEEALRSEIVTLASLYGRYGYRRITALLRRAGWQVNHTRVERIWRQEYNNFRPIALWINARLLTPSDMLIEPWVINKELDKQIVQRLT